MGGGRGGRGNPFGGRGGGMRSVLIAFPFLLNLASAWTILMTMTASRASAGSAEADFQADVPVGNEGDPSRSNQEQIWKSISNALLKIFILALLNE